MHMTAQPAFVLVMQILLFRPITYCCQLKSTQSCKRLMALTDVTHGHGYYVSDHAAEKTTKTCFSSTRHCNSPPAAAQVICTTTCKSFSSGKTQDQQWFVTAASA